uniref:Transmembrane protein n=1 Tax=Megaviridae environmental sample TaxID=1737588 RepID=A0A5J6VJ87_9VIRU|nr:MAG: hypothetical protein [Megaviridae environmental sample]
MNKFITYSLFYEIITISSFSYILPYYALLFLTCLCGWYGCMYSSKRNLQIYMFHISGGIIIRGALCLSLPKIPAIIVGITIIYQLILGYYTYQCIKILNRPPEYPHINYELL